MKWRRLCIDVREDTGETIGGSVEFYLDDKLKPNSVAVLGRTVWGDREAIELLDMEMCMSWPDQQLSFTFHPPVDF